jgi:hypothetical protein
MRAFFACAMLCSASIAHGQAIKPEPPMRSFTEAEMTAVAMPDLKFTETPQDVDTYDKYFFFHRPDTDFATAFADISECDSLASGFRYHSAYQQAAYPYNGTMAGAVGGAIGNALADAIFGSAERRKVRRINMRSCMGFKGYTRYGMEKERWQVFHFEEGFGRVNDEKREGYLLKQAKVASGPVPQLKALEP